MTELTLNLEPSYEEDYTKSANSLFHFMKEFSFLEDALKRKALVPRYCSEDIDYLQINNGLGTVSKIAVLQKCFCDTPLHKITTDFYFKSNLGVGEFGGTCHTDLYGEYAIAFSKSWAERNNLQPIHYLNPESKYAHDFGALLSDFINRKSLSQKHSKDMIHRLTLLKPLRGHMSRIIENKEEIYNKNFHDEQEWRYVPDVWNKKGGKPKVQPIIADQFIFEAGNGMLGQISKSLERKEFDYLWLNFEYNDIRYIIVPDNQTRIKLIEFIGSSLQNKNFEEHSYLAKNILISKILVLDEIRKDW